MKKSKWLDKFENGTSLQENPNNSVVKLPPNYVGLGYDTSSRKFSPAWGGQFEHGGEIAQNGKLVPVSPLQQIQQAVEPTPTVPYLQTKDPAEFYKSWIQSPEYERRLKATGYSDVPNRWHPDKLSEIEEVKKQRLNLLENIQPLEYDPSKRSEAFPFDVGGPTINVNPSDYKTFSKQSVEAHEIAHVGTPTMGGNEFGIFMGSMLPLKKPIVSGVQGSKEREAAIETLEDFEHLQKPLEAKADLDALRFMMYDKGIYDITKGKKFTETDFEKAKQSFEKDRVFKRLTDRMGKKNFINLMNIIAKADDQEEAPIAMGGMSIPGSVGFTYARVAGAAPSKGKYAKKTMASAQNGIMSPMLLARNVLNYFYPSEEAAPTVAAAPVEYKKGLTDELLKRQAYKESTFNPAAVSPAGYKGLTQIGESVLKDYSKKKGGKKLDPFNPEDAVELQKFAMDDLYNASFINKPNQPDSVRLAKTLAAYNWGRGNLANYLNEQKSKGIDIYDSYDWLNNLPKETSDYVNKILLQEDPSFNKNYKKASTNPKYEDITSLYDQKMFGGDIPSAQNGQEMKFYQNGLDWKPKSMQPGGNIERVSINDPRYPELHKNRQVGAYYDGAYSLPDLDEVTVTAPRSYTIDSLRDFTTAALYGAPANAMKLSMIPQAAMTEGIEALRGEPYDFSNVNPNFGGFTSNQRDLSQTMGYENPEGFLQNAANIGLSMIDPAILIGGKGALRQPVKQGLKKADIQKSGFPNPLRVIDSVIPRPLAPGNLFGLEDSWNNYSPLNLIPGYGKRLVDESSSYPDFVGFRKFGNSIDDVIESKSLRPRGSGMGSQQTRLEGNWAESGRVNENYPGVFEATMNPKVPGSNIQLQKVPRRSGILGTTKEGDVEIPLTDPGLSFNRRLPFSNRYVSIDKDKLINDEFQMSTLAPSLQSLAEKYAIWSGLGAGAGALGYSQLSDANEKYIINPAVEKYKNLDERLNKMFGISKKKDGGIVKDNQGYWNPDNWGRPVEIDSNDITMEGVYEPLLGVSDTGDAKLMKPGKNYKFKGKKVTEYPVAELGINQLDAQPMKKLNQLLNFTNNPDKDNWLDKYN